MLVLLLQRGRLDAGDEGGGFGIREVAVAGGDALLDGPRTAGVPLQELLIVVGFDDQGLDAASGLADQAGSESEVSEDGEGDMATFDAKAHGIRGIVGHGEGQGLEACDVKGPAVLKNADFGTFECFWGKCARGCCVAVARCAPLAQEDAQASGMVGMFMGEQDASQ